MLVESEIYNRLGLIFRQLRGRDNVFLWPGQPVSDLLDGPDSLATVIGAVHGHFGVWIGAGELKAIGTVEDLVRRIFTAQLEAEKVEPTPPQTNLVDPPKAEIVQKSPANVRGIDMRVAVITFVYNEAVNLPIWLNYFGRNFGERNLFVVDRESTDGSTDNMGQANKIVLPRTKFDEHRKTGLLTSLHQALLYEYDAVIYTDCDEIIVPDPAIYPSLADYVSRMEDDYVGCVGLNIHHVISREAPLDLEQPILSQRRYARFLSASCKTLISKVPIQWLPGFHCSDKPPRIDPNLYMVHLKFMDYGLSMARQKINIETEWSERSLTENFGAHHRYDYERFVQEGFLDAAHVVRHTKLQEFDFSENISRIAASTVEHDGFYYIPMDVVSWVEIPERFRSSV